MQEHSLRQVSISAVGLLLAITAAAQTSYRVTDLGALHDGVFGCAIGLNNRGWTESMDGVWSRISNALKRLGFRSD